MSTKHRPQQVAPKAPFCPLSVKMKLALLTLNLVRSVLTHCHTRNQTSSFRCPWVESACASLSPPCHLLLPLSMVFLLLLISARKAFPSSNVVTFKGWLSRGRRDSPMATEHTAFVEDHCVVLSMHLRQLSNACSPREFDTL